MDKYEKLAHGTDLIGTLAQSELIVSELRRLATMIDPNGNGEIWFENAMRCGHEMLAKYVVARGSQLSGIDQ